MTHDTERKETNLQEPISLSFKILFLFLGAFLIFFMAIFNTMNEMSKEINDIKWNTKWTYQEASSIETHLKWK